MKVTIAQCETSETFAETADNPGMWIYLGDNDEPLPAELTPRMAGWLEKYQRSSFWTSRDMVDQRRVVQERIYDTLETHD
jgi:hypothetical protein